MLRASLRAAFTYLNCIEKELNYLFCCKDLFNSTSFFLNTLNPQKEQAKLRSIITL